MTPLALWAVANVLIWGSCALFLVDRLGRKRTAGLQALGCFVGAVASFLGRDFAFFWLMTGLGAINLWLWWHSGGDDDWRKRRRKAASWLRSHLPRPVIIPVRAFT